MNRFIQLFSKVALLLLLFSLDSDANIFKQRYKRDFGFKKFTSDLTNWAGNVFNTNKQVPNSPNRDLNQNNRRHKLVQLGAKKLITIDDVQQKWPNFPRYIADSENHINSHSDGKNRYKIDQIVSLTEKQVSGILYTLNVNLKETDCVKNSQEANQNCNTLPGALEKKCQLEIWIQAWMKKVTTTISCEPNENYTFESEAK